MSPIGFRSNPFTFKIRNFKSLVIFCNCTAWFVSDLVENQNVGFLMAHMANKTIIIKVVWGHIFFPYPGYNYTVTLSLISIEHMADTDLS